MAKGRKKKKKSVQTTLKFELLGIAMLLFSAIALFRTGSVGRSLTILFRFTVGVLDWIIPLVFIYLAFFVMINRAWPRSWTPKKSGILLALLGWILMNQMSFIHQLVSSTDAITPSLIWNDTWKTLKEGISTYPSQGDILTREIGGGIIGAFLYSCLFFLFGYEGTVIMVVALFAVGAMLLTGISFVDVGMKLRTSLQTLRKGLSNRMSEWAKSRRAQAAAPKKSKKAPVYLDEVDEADEEEVGGPEPEAVRKPIFFPRLPSAKKKEAIPSEPAVEETVYVNESAAPIPYIRDFQDHIEPPVEDPAVLSAPPVSSSVPENKGAESSEDFPELGLAADKEKPPSKPYQLPGFQLLSRPAGAGKGGEMNDYKANARKLEATLESFGVRAKVLEVVRGPSVTRYEIQPDVGVKVSRIVSLTDDIALALAAKDIRMEAPIPGKSAIGIEVPNTEVSIVTLREVMESGVFQDAASKLSITLGRDISGQPIVGNLAKMPHLLVAGATGSGKSVCINGIITSILFKAKPDEVKFLMIDPKMVELNVYNGIPHLLAPVVTDPRRASLALKKIVVEMEKRYELFSKSGTRNIEGYNAMLTDKNNPNPGEPLPLIVVIVDELADLMMVAANDVEDAICRLAQMARAAGIHLIIATQRPSVDVITGVIKANIPSRIAFGVSSQVDSRTILDMAGAEKLLGRGDMLFLPVGASKPVRVQGAFLSDQEVEAVVSFVSNQEKANYQEDLVPQVEDIPEAEDTFEDELYDQAVQIVLEAKQASVSLLQRRMRVGYTRAARLIDTMEAKGVVGPYEGSKPREVLLTLDQFQQNRISS
ncbi:DNA translocase FtsK [Paenibacillus aurantius]|uniref:DNA translocase FtsK n=1 Tax=Paenibacillus aurantius TaxID=2918900 RepID=A0AA96LI82_9BACL|nr:DNA translocase FtsK [Paenibacillus aurantius]WNQ13789.1 DNA translocase FtsK [Paenibacillus aurantius]